MDAKTAFGEGEVLTPEMRARMEEFYDQVDVDLFEAERREHRALCERAAERARKRGDAKAAERIMARFAKWDEEHLRRFCREQVPGGADGKGACHA